MNDTTKKWLDDATGFDLRDVKDDIVKLDWGDSLPVVDEELKLMGYALSHDDMLELERGQGQSWSSIAHIAAIEFEDATMFGLQWDDLGDRCWLLPSDVEEE